jgi:hypothetical protein
MRKLKIGVVAAAAFVIAGVTAPVPTIAKSAESKVVICHTPGHQNDSLNFQGFCGGPQAPTNDKIIEIEVSTAACKAHLGGPCQLGT